MAADLRPTALDPATADSTDPRRCRAAERSPEAAEPRDRRVDGALDLKTTRNKHLPLIVRFFKRCSIVTYNTYRQRCDREIRHLDVIGKSTWEFSLAANAFNEQSRDI